MTKAKDVPQEEKDLDEEELEEETPEEEAEEPAEPEEEKPKAKAAKAVKPKVAKAQVGFFMVENVKHDGVDLAVGTRCPAELVKSFVEKGFAEERK